MIDSLGFLSQNRICLASGESNFRLCYPAKDSNPAMISIDEDQSYFFLPPGRNHLRAEVNQPDDLCWRTQVCSPREGQATDLAGAGSFGSRTYPRSSAVLAQISQIVPMRGSPGSHTPALDGSTERVGLIGVLATQIDPRRLGVDGVDPVSGTNLVGYGQIAGSIDWDAAGPIEQQPQH
jgi:hypothetical protein